MFDKDKKQITEALHSILEFAEMTKNSVSIHYQKKDDDEYVNNFLKAFDDYQINSTKAFLLSVTKTFMPVIERVLSKQIIINRGSQSGPCAETKQEDVS